MLSFRESLVVEFKSDKSCLPDRDLLAAVISLANTEGGELYLGVEDNGEITGLHPRHRDITTLAALIGNKSCPPLSVRVELQEIDGQQVAVIKVPKSRQLVATSEGLLQRRRLMADGTPQAVPFYPHEFIQRQSTLGLVDQTAMVVTEATTDDFNPLERERLQQMITRYGGDQSLLPLSDPELDGAMGFVTTIDGVKHPTIAGLLILGREEALRRFIPAHEVAFQVLDGTTVKTNIFYRAPLLQTFERLMQMFEARLEEEELQVGLFRVPVPNFHKRAFREALVNSLVHRDYTRLGAVHVRLENDGLTISNPGGFVEGVNLSNLLVSEPRPRNPLLADIVKRIGLAERTGRGIDLIYEGLLRFGRPAPDYSRSDAVSVILRMSNAAADKDFLRLILQEEDKLGRTLPLDSLIILSRLRTERRMVTTALAESTQRGEAETRAALEKLVESGLVEAHGTGRGRAYTLSSGVYQKTGETIGYIRQVGFKPIQHEQMILNYIEKNGRIKREEVMELCMLTKDQAWKLLRKLKENNKIIQIGERKMAYYILRSE